MPAVFVCNREKETERVLYQEGICVLACLLTGLYVCVRTIDLFVYTKVFVCVEIAQLPACLSLRMFVCTCVYNMCTRRQTCMYVSVQVYCVYNFYVYQAPLFLFACNSFSMFYRNGRFSGMTSEVLFMCVCWRKRLLYFFCCSVCILLNYLT